jgi:hypothetical protein
MMQGVERCPCCSAARRPHADDDTFLDYTFGRA